MRRFNVSLSFVSGLITGCCLPVIAFAQGVTVRNFVPLVPDLPLLTNAQPTVAGILNALFGITVGAAAILAVIMVAIGGFGIMTTDSPFKLSDGKDRILQAILGLLIILASILILNTINQNITTLDPFANVNLIPAANTGTTLGGAGGGAAGGGAGGGGQPANPQTGTSFQTNAVNGQCAAPPAGYTVVQSGTVCNYTAPGPAPTPGNPGTVSGGAQTPAPTQPGTGQPTVPPPPPAAPTTPTNTTQPANLPPPPAVPPPAGGSTQPGNATAPMNT